MNPTNMADDGAGVPQDATASPTYRVLVVDDDETLLALTRLSLAKDGVEVATTRSPFEGLGLVRRTRPDLVILDVVLPELSGWETLRRIREVSTVPVMLLSARDSDVDKARGLDLGADDYLTKPYSLLEFEARVRALLRRARLAPRVIHLGRPESGRCEVNR